METSVTANASADVLIGVAQHGQYLSLITYVTNVGEPTDTSHIRVFIGPTELGELHSQLIEAARKVRRIAEEGGIDLTSQE